MSILVIAEHDNSTLRPSTLTTITAGSKLGGVTVLVAGFGCSSVADEAASYENVDKVVLVDDSCYEHGLAETISQLVVSIASDYTHILASATTFGKNMLPRVAALLDVSQISDVIEVLDSNTFKRPIYAGNAIATVASSESQKVITIRGTAFDAIEKGGSTASVETLDSPPVDALATFVNRELTVSDRPDLSSARIVVSGGRGVGSAENFAILESLADKLGAAVGASRAAVDAGFVPNDYQVGQTGKIVAPDIYFAIGISGAIQHLAGMKDSKVIVAINKDEEAPIFEVADYGIVDDLFKIVPELTEILD